MTIDNPGFTLPTSNERELLLSYLRAQRGDVVRSADGLDEAQLRWTPDDRLLPIIGVINHLTHVEWRWINGRYLAEPFPPRDEEFVLGPEVTGAEIVAAYAARRAAPTRSCAPLPASRNRASGAKVTGRLRTCCSGSHSRSICAGRCCTSSRRPRTTPVTPTRRARCSTAPAPTSCSAASEAAPPLTLGPLTSRLEIPRRSARRDTEAARAGGGR